MEVMADGFKQGWSSFLTNGSDFAPAGKSVVRLDWVSQLSVSVYTWLAARILEPIDVLHLWILAGWITSGAVVYWVLRRTNSPRIVAACCGAVIQVIPAFRWFAMNHVSYMFLALALLPASLILLPFRELTPIKFRRRGASALFSIAALSLLDGYIAYFSLLLLILALIWLTSVTSNRSIRTSSLTAGGLLIVGLVIAGRLFQMANESNPNVPERGFNSVTVLDVGSLVDSRYDIGFGNLQPYVGWGVLLLLSVGVFNYRRETHRVLFALTLLAAGAFTVSIGSFTLNLPGDLWGRYVPRFRYYDRYAVVTAIALLVIAYGLGLGTKYLTSKRVILTATTVCVSIVLVDSYQPHAFRGATDGSVNVLSIVQSLNPRQEIALRIGGPPMFAGVRFNSFASPWSEILALSRGNRSFSSLACRAGSTHVLVNGELDGVWQNRQPMSAYSPREWVNFDDSRYFRLISRGWWDDYSSATEFSRQPLRLYRLTNCGKSSSTLVPIDLDGIEVENDGVLVRQVRDDQFRDTNFSLSPTVTVRPKNHYLYRASELQWQLTIGSTDHHGQLGSDVSLLLSGSGQAQVIHLRNGKSMFISATSSFPHELLIESITPGEANFYFFIDDFWVRPADSGK